MQRTLSLRTAIIGAIVLALGAGALVYAASLIYDNPTGQFSLDAEGATADVVTLNNVTGGAEPGWASCSRSGDASAVGYCLMSVTNTKVSSALQVTASLHDLTGSAGLVALSNTLHGRWYVSSGATTCADPAMTGWAAVTPGAALSALPSSGSVGLPVSDGQLFCFRVYVDDPGNIHPEAFGQTLSGIIRVTTDDS